MIENSNMNCCGIREIHYLAEFQTAAEAMTEFLEESSPLPLHYDPNGPPMRRDKFCYAVFSGTKRSKYVDRFTAFITTNKLGEVIETGWNRNPNSGNQLKVCVWTIDWEALRAYEAKQKEVTSGKGEQSTPVEADAIV